MIYTVGEPTKVSLATLQDVKDNLRLTHDYQDDLLCAYNATAHTVLSNYIGSFIAMREVTARGDRFLQDMPLRHTPVSGDIAIKYRDRENQLQTLDPALYTLTDNSAGQAIITYFDFNTLPEVYDSRTAVTITYSAGYTERTAPPVFKQFILLLTAKMYENPGDSALKYQSFAKSMLFYYKKQVTDAA